MGTFWREDADEQERARDERESIPMRGLLFGLAGSAVLWAIIVAALVMPASVMPFLLLAVAAIGSAVALWLE